MPNLCRYMFVLGMVILGLTATARAEDYPNRPIKLVICFAAGTGIDTDARVLEKYLSPALKQHIVILNKPGALGSIGATYASHAEPDGYTLVIAPSITLMGVPSLFKNVSFDPIKDFTPIAMIGIHPSMILVRPDLPIHSVQDMIAYAKAKPGELSYGAGNAGAIVLGKALQHRAGIKLLQVTYPSVPAAVVDALAGRVSMVFSVDFNVGNPQIRAGKLRAIAVTSDKRSSVLTGLPGMDESGFPGLNVKVWQGLFAPANTPKPIVARLQKALKTVLSDPAVKARFAKIGFEVSYLPTPQFDDYIKAELKRWTNLVKNEAGIKPK
jgi:putative tricarboxylic transport membrane protein